MTFPSPWARPGAPKSRKELYKEEYEAAKKEGKPFFPDTIFKDAVVALLVIGIIVAMSVLVPVPTESIADPASTTYNPRPEWYFLFLFEMLKFFPGYLEPVAAAVIPGVAVLLLLLLPFLERKRERHPANRPLTVVVALIALFAVGLLTFRGATAPLVSPGGEESIQVAEGRRVYGELNCSYCHSINGVGGAVGPDLGVASRGLDAGQVAQYLQNPHAMVPKSLHPKLQFTREEVQALSAYISSIGAVPSYSENAPLLFEKYCASCHTTDGTGGRVGPDLSRVGTFRTQPYLKAFISEPKSVLPSSTMPAFGKVLNDAELADLAAYLSSLRGPATVTESTPTPAPTPTPTPSPTQPPGVVSYSRDVQPVLERYCNACHGAAAMGGLNMTNYQSLMTTGQHSPVVMPGNVDSSILYQTIQGTAPGILR
ncbi:MAG: c-type cytochrome, partial [Chloroflexota bacterium]